MSNECVFNMKSGCMSDSLHASDMVQMVEN